MENKDIIFLSAFMLVPVQFVYSAPSLHYLDVGIRYVSGDFGTARTTTLKQLEMNYGVFKGDYDLSAFFSYEKLSDETSNESGIGDLTLRASKKLYEEAGYGDYLYGSVAIKLPTADETSGLGTGEVDIGGFINYTHRLDSANLLLSAGYIMVGDSNTVQYNDVFNYGIGLSKKMQNIFAYVNLEGRQQVQATGDNPLELTVGIFYQLDINHYIRGDALFGLSDGSPDNGLAIGITNWF